MKVLFAVSECAPFVKTGGLADVAGALPKALTARRISTRVLMPAYPALKALKGAKPVAEMEGGRLLAVKAAGLSLLLLDCPDLFDRDGGPYLGPEGRDWPDNPFRFAALSRAAARVAREGAGDWKPDVLHVHDWQTALAPLYMRQRGDAIPSVLTIHNIAFQGVFPAALIGALGLDPSGFTPQGYEYYGQVGFMKAGLVSADRITTVSPTYARELAQPGFGMGLEGVIAARARNRAALAERFGLEARDDAPLFGLVGRLTRQKGIDLLLEALPRLLARGATLALIGSGDADMEAAFRAAATAHPGRVGAVIGYSEPLAHLMQGGADVILAPSRFEPCGLTQLYALRYGAAPLVARTGGLADTVIDANEAAIAAGCATGFQFAPVETAALADAVDRACDAFADRALWARIMANAMAAEVGWGASAARYAALYKHLAAS